MNDRIPPHNLDAEMAVLGAILLNPDAMDVAFEILGNHPGVFYAQAHQQIYRAIVALERKKVGVDITTLCNELTVSEDLESMGGASYIAKLAGAVPVSSSVEHYARIVHKASMFRVVLNRLPQIEAQAYEGEITVEEMAEKLDSLGTGIQAPDSDFEIEALDEFIDEACDDMIAAMEHEGVAGVQTGFKQFDALTGGLGYGDYITIAGRTSEGKTAFALNLAHSIVRQGVPVMFFSMEMSKKQLGRRLLHYESKLTLRDVRDGKESGFLSANKLSATDAANRIRGYPLYVDETPHLTMAQLKLRAKRMVKKKGVKAVFVDYIGLVKPSEKFESQVAALSAISKEMKALSRVLEVPVISLAQLNRDSVDKRPSLNNLKGASALEEDSDTVILLSKAESIDQGVLIDVAKQRNGITQEIVMRFSKQYQRFDELTETGIHDDDGIGEQEELIPG